KKVCNGTIGIVINFDLSFLEVRVAFNVIGGIIDIVIKRESDKFIVDGKPFSRCQFSLQIAFTLTVHKTHCTDWSKVYIASFHPSAFINDMSMVEEYRRLEKKASTPLPL
ncbi:9208_t:CDS:2, partial [Funneliformis mosseae]